MEQTINLCSRDGYSPLFKACQKGHESTVQLLLRNKAEINLCMKDTASPLFIACRNGYESIVQLLRRNGTKDDLCDKDCWSEHDSTVTE